MLQVIKIRKQQLVRCRTLKNAVALRRMFFTWRRAEVFFLAAAELVHESSAPE